MPRKKKTPEISFIEKLIKLKKAGISPNRPLSSEINIDNLDSLEIRLEKILGIVKKRKKSTDMLFFIMYDIENDKVRTQISKYLAKKGCTRIQKSIFLVNTTREKYTEISDTLKQVNEMYKNNDSIMLVPVSTDELRAMKIIGCNINLDIILKNKNTLIF